MTIRIGVVGAGFIAGRHVESLTGLDGVAVTGVADPQTDRARRLAERAGGRPHGSWEDLLDGEDLDALYVCVPPAQHGAVEDAAIDAGLPLFVEKPLDTDLATAERLAARIEATGLLAAVGYHWRYLDTLEQARGLLAGRPPRLLLGTWLDAAPTAPWWARQDQSGGQTVEQATHLLDVARVLAGEVASGWAAGGRSPDGPGDVHDACTASLRFAGGALGSFSSTCVAPRGWRIGLQVVAPGLGLELTEHELRITDADGERTVERARDPIEAEDAAFVAAVRGEGDDVRTPYTEALRTHRLAVAVARAAARGGTVAL